eukprot:scaffold328920_cov52-Tisochrysis_lutea.AAC.10
MAAVSRPRRRVPPRAKQLVGELWRLDHRHLRVRLLLRRQGALHRSVDESTRGGARLSAAPGERAHRTTPPLPRIAPAGAARGSPAAAAAQAGSRDGVGAARGGGGAARCRRSCRQDGKRGGCRRLSDSPACARRRCCRRPSAEAAAEADAVWRVRGVLCAELRKVPFLPRYAAVRRWRHAAAAMHPATVPEQDVRGYGGRAHRPAAGAGAARGVR